MTKKCAANYELRPEDLKCDPCGRKFSEIRFYMMHFVRVHKTMPPGYEGRQTFKCEYKNCEHLSLTQAQWSIINNSIRKIQSKFLRLFWTFFNNKPKLKSCIPLFS